MELDEERQNGELLMERIDRGREQVNVSHNTFFFPRMFRMFDSTEGTEKGNCSQLNSLQYSNTVLLLSTYFICKHVKTPHRLLCERVYPA